MIHVEGFFNTSHVSRLTAHDEHSPLTTHLHVSRFTKKLNLQNVLLHQSPSHHLHRYLVQWHVYIVRLFIYNTEAGEKDAIEKEILRKQFAIMIRRLWLGITWPSAILTLIFGIWITYLLVAFHHGFG